MKRRRLFDLATGCCLLLISLNCQGQDSFRYQAAVDTVGTTGFYAIGLSPELLAKSNASLSDLRLRNAQGHFVPYVLSPMIPGMDSGGIRRLPDPVFRQKDSSNRHSYLDLEWLEDYRIEKLSLEISEPVLFKRMVSVYAGEPGGSYSLVEQLSIEPHKTMFGMPVVKSRKLRIDIANADNAPLKVRGIFAWQDIVHMVSFLQGSSTYEILTGENNAIAPEYDLHFFTDSMTQKPKELGIGAIREVKLADIAATAPVAGQSKAQGDVRESVLLWGCLLAVLLFLIYFSIRLVKAIGKKDTHDRL
jgi:hypothetical protein